MAHFQRLIALWLFCVSFSALAAFPPYERVQYFYNQQNLYFDDLNAACAAAFPIVIASIPQVFKPIKGQKVTDLGDQGGHCEVESNGNGWYSAAISRHIINSCPANSTLSAGLCICSEGTKEQIGSDGNKVCLEDRPPTADEACSAHSYAFNSWSVPQDRSATVKNSGLLPLDEPFNVCMALSGKDYGPNTPPGCKHKFTPQMRYRMSDDEPYLYSGDSWALGPNDLAEAGGTLACVPGLDDVPGDPPIPPAKKPDPECKGGIPGEVQGVKVCIDPSAVQTEGVDWTRVTDSNGNVKEQKTEVSCVGEKCTVKTTTKTPGGTDENVTTTTVTRGQYCAKNPESAICKGDKDNTGSTRNQNGRGGSGVPASGGGGDGEGDGFCKENPDSPMCKKSAFGGSCGAWTCDGDAIQCAIAREQHQRNCKLFDESPDSVYAAAADGSDGINADKLKSEAQQVSVGSFDSAGFGWGSSCPADPFIPLNFGGRSAEFSIPFSRICGPLGILSMAGVGITLLGSMVWVLGGRNNRG